MSSRRWAAGPSMILYVGLAFMQRAAGVLLLPFLTRVMEPGAYGQASTVTATSLLFGVVLGSALETAVFRWAARQDSEKDAILGLSQAYIYAVLPLMGAAAAGFLYLSRLNVLGIPWSIWAIEIIAATLLPAATYFALPVLRASRQVLRIAVITAATVVLTVASKLWLLSIFSDKLFAWVVADIVVGAGTYVVALCTVRTRWRLGTSDQVRALLRFSLPLVPHRLSFWALQSLNRPVLILVGASYGLVGLFSFASNISVLVWTILGEVNRAALPEYSRETFPAPTERTRRLARVQVFAAFSIPAVMALLILFGAPFFIGRDYHSAFPSVAILLVGQVAYGLYLVPANYLIQASGRTRFAAVSSTSGASVILLGLLIVGSLESLPLASWVTVAGFCVMAALSFMSLKMLHLVVRWSDILPNSATLVLLTAGLASSLIALAASTSFWFGFFLSTATLVFIASAVFYRRGWLGIGNNVRIGPNSWVGRG